MNRRDFLKNMLIAGGLAAGCSSSYQCREAAAGHPSLHFDADGLQRLRRRAKGKHRRYAEALYKWVDRYHTWMPPAIPEPAAAGAEVPLEHTSAFVTNAALAFVLSQRDDYLQLTRKWASVMCENPGEKCPGYGSGIYAAGLARVYDWLYHYLDDAERKRIRTYLVNVVGQMSRGSVVGSDTELWWANVPMHHDNWVAIAGYGEAALSILGEVEDAYLWADSARNFLANSLSWFGDDGAWHEGAADWVYAMAPLLWFYGAWQSVVGENLHDVPWLRNTATYRFYNWLPDDSYIYLNDSFRSGRYNTSGSASCHVLRRLASLFRDGYSQWLADRDELLDTKSGSEGVYEAPYGKELKKYQHAPAHCAAWNVLWYDPTVKPVSPAELPRARHFKNQGIVIMRTGWEKDAAVVSLACAPIAGQCAAERIRAGQKIFYNNYGHAHFDYSSFTLFAGGQYFIVPPGYGRRSSKFQNVLTINGTGFSLDPSINIRIAAFQTQPRFCYAVADATDAFPPKLQVQKYHRHILLLNSGWMILFDDLQLTDTGGEKGSSNSVVWTVHSDPTTHRLSVSSNKAIWKTLLGGGSALVMHLLQPQDFTLEHSPLELSAGAGRLEVLRLCPSGGNHGRINILSAWTWQDKPQRPTLLRHQDFLAVLWEADSDAPAVGFALSDDVPSDFSHSDLAGRELLLFGHDLARPDI